MGMESSRGGVFVGKNIYGVPQSTYIHASKSRDDLTFYFIHSRINWESSYLNGKCAHIRFYLYFWNSNILLKNSITRLKSFFHEMINILKMNCQISNKKKKKQKPSSLIQVSPLPQQSIQAKSKKNFSCYSIVNSVFSTNVFTVSRCSPFLFVCADGSKLDFS